MTFSKECVQRTHHPWRAGKSQATPTYLLGSWKCMLVGSRPHIQQYQRRDYTLFNQRHRPLDNPSRPRRSDVVKDAASRRRVSAVSRRAPSEQDWASAGTDCRSTNPRTHAIAAAPASKFKFNGGRPGPVSRPLELALIVSRGEAYLSLFTTSFLAYFLLLASHRWFVCEHFYPFRANGIFTMASLPC